MAKKSKTKVVAEPEPEPEPSPPTPPDVRHLRAYHASGEKVATSVLLEDIDDFRKETVPAIAKNVVSALPALLVQPEPEPESEPESGVSIPVYIPKEDTESKIERLEFEIESMVFFIQEEKEKKEPQQEYIVELREAIKAKNAELENLQSPTQSSIAAPKKKSDVAGTGSGADHATSIPIPRARLKSKKSRRRKKKPKKTRKSKKTRKYKTRRRRR